MTTLNSPGSDLLNQPLRLPDGSQLAEIGELLTAGVVHPVIDKVFPFAETKEALAYLELGRAKGKVVVQMSK